MFKEPFWVASPWYSELDNMVHPKVPPRQLLDCPFRPEFVYAAQVQTTRRTERAVTDQRDSNRKTEEEPAYTIKAGGEETRAKQYKRKIPENTSQADTPIRVSVAPSGDCSVPGSHPRPSVFHLRMHSRIARFKTRRRLRSCSSSVASGDDGHELLVLGIAEEPRCRSLESTRLPQKV